VCCEIGAAPCAGANSLRGGRRPAVQVAKLESLGLVQRQANAADRRVREAIVSPEGKAMTDRVDAARDRIGHAIFETWDPARD